MEKLQEICVRHGATGVFTGCIHIRLEHSLADLLGELHETYGIVCIREYAVNKMPVIQVILKVGKVSITIDCPPQKVFSDQFNRVKKYILHHSSDLDRSGGKVKYLYGIADINNAPSFAEVEYSENYYEEYNCGRINQSSPDRNLYYTYTIDGFYEIQKLNDPTTIIKRYSYFIYPPYPENIQEYLCSPATLPAVLALNPKRVRIKGKLTNELAQMLAESNVKKLTLLTPMPIARILKVLENTNIKYLKVTSHKLMNIDIMQYPHLVQFKWIHVTTRPGHNAIRAYDCDNELLHMWHSRTFALKSARNL